MITLDTSPHRRSEPDFRFSIWGPRGCPPGRPKIAPKFKFIEIHRVWCPSLRLDAYCSAETFFWRTDPHGARESPQRAPQMGIHPTSTEIHLRMVSIDSSRCILSIYNILLENRPSWAPRSTKGHPKWAPSLGTYSTSVLVTNVKATAVYTFTNATFNDLENRMLV